MGTSDKHSRVPILKRSGPGMKNLFLAGGPLYASKYFEACAEVTWNLLPE